MERVARQALAVAREVTDDYEVIVVDDGSRDNTALIAGQLAEQDPHLRLLRHETNLGYGSALRTGFYAARKDVIFYTDGDGQFDLNEIHLLLPLIEQSEIVCGYRIKRSDPFIRRVNAWLWGTLVNILFGFKVRDVDCAFKLFQRKVFKKIELNAEGALIDTEILAKAASAGFNIVQVGVHHYPRVAGQQTGAQLKVIIKAFKELFVLKGRIKKEQIQVLRQQ